MVVKGKLWPFIFLMGNVQFGQTAQPDKLALALL